MTALPVPALEQPRAVLPRGYYWQLFPQPESWPRNRKQLNSVLPDSPARAFSQREFCGCESNSWRESCSPRSLVILLEGQSRLAFPVL